MHNIKKVVLLAILCILNSCNFLEKPVETPKPAMEQITEQEALKLLHNWTNAYLTGNAKALDSILDPSWVYSGSPDGVITNKTATIEEFSNADYTFGDISYENLDVQLYEDIAVVRGSETMIIIGSASDTTKLKLRFTDVYRKKDGKIKAIATHSSPIIEEE